MSQPDRIADDARGFAGLLDLVSDGVAESFAISQEAARASEAALRAAKERDKTGPVETAIRWIRTAFENQVAPQHRKAVLVVFAVIALIAALSINSTLQENSVSPMRSAAPRSQSAGAAATLAPSVPQVVAPPLNDNIEVAPPAGTDLVLTRQQIRYCLR